MKTSGLQGPLRSLKKLLYQFMIRREKRAFTKLGLELGNLRGTHTLNVIEFNAQSRISSSKSLKRALCLQTLT